MDMKQCQNCGRWDKYLRPEQVGNDVLWYCPRCPSPEGAIPLAIPYEHRLYPPGVSVYVLPAILDVHPLSPIAGQTVQVVAGGYYPLLEASGGRSHETMVPVKAQGGREWLVEEEYVALYYCGLKG